MLLPLGALESLAIPGESYKLALTPGLVTKKFAGKVTDLSCARRGRAVRAQRRGHQSGGPVRGAGSLPGTDDDAASERAYACAHRFLLERIRDPFHREGFETESLVGLTMPDHLLIVESRDALDNIGRNWKRLSRDAAELAVLSPTAIVASWRSIHREWWWVRQMMGKALPAPVRGDSFCRVQCRPGRSHAFRSSGNNPLVDPHAILQGATDASGSRIHPSLTIEPRTNWKPDPRLRTFWRGKLTTLILPRARKPKSSTPSFTPDGFGLGIFRKKSRRSRGRLSKILDGP